MSNDINLILSKQGQSLKRKKRLVIIQRVAVVFLVITALISIILFLLNTINSISDIRKEQTSILTSIGGLKDKSSKLVMVNDRLKNINNITKKRKSYTTLMSYFKEAFGDLTVSVFEVDKKSMLITVSSKSLLAENEFLAKMIEKSGKKQLFKNLIIQTLTVNEQTGNYTLILKAEVI